MTVTEARAHLDQADRALAEAQAACDRARAQLDRALGDIGWRRLPLVGSPTQTPLYSSLAYPDAALSVDQIVAMVEAQRGALA